VKEEEEKEERTEEREIKKKVIRVSKKTITMQRNHSTTSRISVLALLVVLIISVTFLMEETVAWIATTTTTPMTGIRTLPIVLCDRSSTSPRRTAAVASSPRASTVARRGSSIFYEVDPDECPDEEECEINWDLMPGFSENEDNEDEETATIQKEAEAVYASQQLTQQHTLGKYERTTVTKSRMLLDMTWQIEQCEVEEEAEAMATSLSSSSSSCTDFCAECAGAGTHYCNFCRGTRTIAFGNGEFRTCLICNNEGKMPCSSCQGSGHVATWIPELYQQQQPPHD